MAVMHIRDFPDNVYTDLRVEIAYAKSNLRDFVAEAVKREVARRRTERERKERRERDR
jgi:hypothetical protein